MQHSWTADVKCAEKDQKVTDTVFYTNMKLC